MPLTIQRTPKQVNPGDKLSFRAAPDVAAMLTRAIKDHPAASKVINQCLRDALKAAGYARKMEGAQ